MCGCLSYFPQHLASPLNVLQQFLRPNMNRNEKFEKPTMLFKTTSVQKSVFPCCCSERAWSANSTDGSQKYLGTNNLIRWATRRGGDRWIHFTSKHAFRHNLTCVLWGFFGWGIFFHNYYNQTFFLWSLSNSTCWEPGSWTCPRLSSSCNAISSSEIRDEHIYSIRHYLYIRQASTTARTELKSSYRHIQRNHQGLLLYLMRDIYWARIDGNLISTSSQADSSSPSIREISVPAKLCSSFSVSPAVLIFQDLKVSKFKWSVTHLSSCFLSCHAAPHFKGRRKKSCPTWSSSENILRQA